MPSMRSRDGRPPRSRKVVKGRLAAKLKPETRPRANMQGGEDAKV